MKTKRIKATISPYSILASSGRQSFWQLPADAESYERMVEQMADKIWDSSSICTRYEQCTYFARAALRAIGITNPTKKR